SRLTEAGAARGSLAPPSAPSSLPRSRRLALPTLPSSNPTEPPVQPLSRESIGTRWGGVAGGSLPYLQARTCVAFLRVPVRRESAGAVLHPPFLTISGGAECGDLFDRGRGRVPGSSWGCWF